MNLQAVQRSIKKKNEDVSGAQYSEPNSKNSSPQLKDGIHMLSVHFLKTKLTYYFLIIYIDYKHVDNWPTSSRKLGAVSAVSLDVYRNVVVFHRGDRAWNAETFDAQNIFKQRYLGPIKENTIITFDRDTGNVINEWGSNLFYMPHGLHINGNYYYITDVGRKNVIFLLRMKNYYFTSR